MKITINYKYIILLILLLSLFEPGYFTQFPTIHSLYLAGKIVCFIIVIIDMISYKRVSKFMILTLLYLFIQLLSTVLNGGSIRNATYEVIVTVGAVGIVYKMVTLNSDKAINEFLLVFEFLTFGNFLSVLFAPAGLYVVEQSSGWWTNMCWFMGIRNGMTLSYVLAAFFQLLYYYRNREKSVMPLVRCITFFTYATITILKINSATTYYGQSTTAGGLTLIWIIILLYFIAIRFEKILVWFDFGKGVILNYILMFALVFCKLQYLFSYIIVVFLKKDLTMTSRVMIWDRVIELMKSKWFLGYGLPKGDSMAVLLGNSATVNTTQNGLLDVIFYGGIVLSLILVMLFYEVGSRLNSQKLDSHYRFFFGYFIAAFLLATQGESIGGMRLFVLLSTMYFIAPSLTVRKSR